MEEKEKKSEDTSVSGSKYSEYTVVPSSVERDAYTNQPTRAYVLTGLPGMDSASVLHYDPESQRFIGSDGLGQPSERTVYLLPSQFVLADQRSPAIAKVGIANHHQDWEANQTVIQQSRQAFHIENLPSDGQLLKSNSGYYFLPNSRRNKVEKVVEKEIVVTPEVEMEVQQIEVGIDELIVPEIVKEGLIGRLDQCSEEDELKCKDCGIVVLCNICSSNQLEIVKLASCGDSSSNEVSDDKSSSGDDSLPLSARRGVDKKKKVKSTPLLLHCTMCIRSFRSRENLLVHKKKHKKTDKNFSCFFCELRFRFEKSYLSHLATHNPNYVPAKKRVSGIGAGKESQKGGVDDFTLEVTADEYKPASTVKIEKGPKGRPPLDKACHICKKAFKNRKSLRDHIILHSSLRPFSCDICGRGFPSRRLMRRHKRAHSVTERKHTCTECGEGFRRPGSLRTHMASHLGIKPYECDICKMRFNSSSHLSRHKKGHLGLRPHICHQCERAFSSKHHMQRHVLTVHLKEKRFACDKCEKRFPTMSHLQQHSVTHSDTRPFKCDFCDMAFTCNAYKKKHMNITHAVDKPFRCDMCTLSFSSNYHLKRHQLIHSGSRPFVCEQCGVGFLMKYALQRHMAVHTGVKPYHCDQCPATFAFSERLKQHTLTHTQEKPFCCHICGARFNLKCSLDQHTRKHTGEQPFVCPTCSRKFSSRSSLSRHRRVHTGARPYPCEICGKGLSSRRALRRHHATHQPTNGVPTAASNPNNLVSVFPITGTQASDGQLITPLHVLQGQFYFEAVQP